MQRSTRRRCFDIGKFLSIFCKFVVYGSSRAGDRATGCITKV